MNHALLLTLALGAIGGAAHAQDAGQTLFVANCSACHQTTGLGVPGAFPALAGDSFVQGDAAAAAGVVLSGRGGMPAFKADLTDAQIAAALSYVRAAWGNKAPPVTAETVATVRAHGAEAPPASLQVH